VEVGEDVVGLVAEFGDGAPRAGHIDGRVGGLDALVADLQGRGRASPAATGEGRDPRIRVEKGLKGCILRKGWSRGQPGRQMLFGVNQKQRSVGKAVAG